MRSRYVLVHEQRGRLAELLLVLRGEVRHLALTGERLLYFGVAHEVVGERLRHNLALRQQVNVRGKVFEDFRQ